MYLKAILFYLSWPLVIVLTWYAARWVLKKFEETRPVSGDSVADQTKDS